MNIRLQSVLQEFGEYILDVLHGPNFSDILKKQTLPAFYEVKGIVKNDDLTDDDKAKKIISVSEKYNIDTIAFHEYLKSEEN